MGRTAYTEPQCLYKGALYLHLYLYLLTNFITIRFQCKSHSFKFPNVFLPLLPLPTYPWVGPDFLFLRFLESNISYEAGSQPHAQIPSRKTRVYLLVWVNIFDLSGMVGPTSSYATASIALRVIWPCRSHRHIKIGIPSVGPNSFRSSNYFKWTILLTQHTLRFTLIII